MREYNGGGFDVKYIVRERVTSDYLFGESPISDFKEYIIIEMQQIRIERFSGDGDIFSKFGIEHSDELTLMVSVKRFAQESESIKLTQPRKGDLIYVPHSDSLWEIRNVKFDNDYYQFGKNYTYRLDCTLFQYSHEELPSDSEYNNNGVGDFNNEYTVSEIESNNPLRMLLGLHEDIVSPHGGEENFREESVDENKQLKTEAGSKLWDASDPFSTGSNNECF